MKRSRAGIVLAALILTACGGGGPAIRQARNVVVAHTSCPQVGQYANPTWSPDSSSIYYSLSMMAPGIDPNTQALIFEPVSSVHVMTAGGSNDRELITGRTLYAVSHDGTMLMLERSNPGGQNSDYDVLDLATMAVRPVASGTINPAWSPGPGEAGDGRWVVYSPISSKNGPLIRVDLQGGSAGPISGSVAGDGIPIWSPGPGAPASPGPARDGGLLAFGSVRDGPGAVYLMQPDGSGLSRIPPGNIPECAGRQPESEVPAAWSPDGRALLIYHSCDTYQRIRLVNPDGTERAVWPHQRWPVFSLEWSPGPGSAPDGKRVLFVSGNGSKNNLFVADPDGTDVQQIATDVWPPAHWSPDGARIAYVKEHQAGYSEIYTINADGSDVKQLTQNPGTGHVCLH